MSAPLPPKVTVRFADGQRTFAPGQDVVVGRHVRADVRLPHLGVSRAHMVLRYLDGRWVAIDNESMNGVYVRGQRVRAVDIHPGQTINVGNANGPLLAFDLEAPVRPAPINLQRPAGPRAAENVSRTEIVKRPNAVSRVLRPGAPAAPLGATLIGSQPDNDIIIHDVLVSGHHAFLTLTPQGVQITDANSTNGTYVNGQRVKEAILHNGDVVTIGNSDMVFANGTLARRTEPASETGGLKVNSVTLTVEGNHTLLDRISFSAGPGKLTALIGPSGSGKSTLLKVIEGGVRPTSGTVSFEQHDVHAAYAQMRTRIGMVPQDDVVHSQLTVNQALGYAAELRMSPDTSKQDRQRVIAQVLEELDMTKHADTRVDKLSGGQRKRASVALELLTGPSLLILDEPTTGLDPVLDQQVMQMLRQLADAGRVVVVVTHSLTFLDLCDQVVMLAPGGKTAFCGPPSGIESAMGTKDWADIFERVAADPDGSQQRFLARAGRPVEAPVPLAAGGPTGKSKELRTGVWRQLSTMARRQVRLIRADRGYFIFLCLLPFLVALLPLTAKGTSGFNVPPPDSTTPNVAITVLVFMNLGAFFMGTALTVRELVGERPIFLREQAAGLSTSAYLAAKVAVFSAAAVIQSAVLVAIVVIVKGAPPSASMLGNGTLELFVGTAATCIGSAMVGLLVSSVAQTSNQVLPLTVVTLMLQVVLAGGFIPVTGRSLDPVSWFVPSRWGLAATASTVDLVKIVPRAPHDAHFQHTAAAWRFDVFMLFVLSALYLIFVRWKIRLKLGGLQRR
jgi:ABC-type multidrug transport system ATPase subunit